MKDFHLRFCLDTRGWYTPLFDLLEDDVGDLLADTGGAYVLGTSDGTMLTYPWGNSPVYYVGKATNLKARLSEHRRYIYGAIENHEELHWWPRYKYGAALGAQCAYYSRKGPESVQNVEAAVIESFYTAFWGDPRCELILAEEDQAAAELKAASLPAQIVAMRGPT